MSFIGREFLLIPPNVVIKQHKNFLIAKGKNGVTKIKIDLGLNVRKLKNRVLLEPRKKNIKSEFSRSWGSLRMNLWKMFLGVFNLFACKMVFIGIGYRYYLNKNYLGLRLGLSHGIKIKLPKSLKISGSKKKRPLSLFLEHTDFMKLKSFCFQLQSLKPPEPYKGKGILFENQKVKRKIGKKKKN
jgi:large subunit ribosomal protein L6